MNHEDYVRMISDYFQEIRDRLDKIKEAVNALQSLESMMKIIDDEDIREMITSTDYPLYIHGFIRRKINSIMCIVTQMEFDAADYDHYEQEEE